MSRPDAVACLLTSTFRNIDAGPGLQPPRSSFEILTVIRGCAARTRRSVAERTAPGSRHEPVTIKNHRSSMCLGSRVQFPVDAASKMELAAYISRVGHRGV